MVDLKKATDELTAKAAFEAAKNAATRAIEDATSTDEERAEREAERAALAKRKRTKLIALGAVGLLLALGVIGLVIGYWHWFLLAGLVGLVALYGRHRWRQRRSAKKGLEAEPPRAARRAPERLPAPAARVAPATKAASDEPDESIEDELAALKARLK